jgi:hypothetical protein
MQANRHIQTLWGQLWQLVLRPLVVLFPLLALTAYVAFGAGGAWAVALLLLALALMLATPVTRDLLFVVLPGLVILVGYGAVRVLRPLFVTPGRVWTCEVHSLDATLFGFGTGLAPSDVFARHNGTIADLVFALPYTVFWGAVLVWCCLLFLISRGRLRRYLWGLALIHLAAFVLWMALPVAPPWYVRAQGCAVDLAVVPQAAALGRLDTLFGITYFADFYARAPTVFGAFPSLHVSFPAVAMITGWRWFGPWGRAITALLTLWMIAASVYLDHHWLVDGLTTLILVLMLHALMRRFWPAYDTADPTAFWREGAR